MNVLDALGKVVDIMKKYCDSRYVQYDDAGSNNEYKTPQDYGAGGKGTTDDTEAINQAIKENDTIFIPNGTYNISSPIIVNASGKKIYGGSNTKIIAQGCDGFDVATPSNTIISDLQITGDRSAHHGIVVSGGGYRCQFVNLQVRDFGGDGFHANWFGAGLGSCMITKCAFRNCDNGIVCLSDALDQRNNITISNNTLAQITKSAIRVTGCGISIEKNDIEHCEYAIRVDNWDVVPTRENDEFCGTWAIRIVGNYMEAARHAFMSFASNYRAATDTLPKMYGIVDGVTIQGNYAFLAKTIEVSDDPANVEFISYILDEGTAFQDVTFEGNVFYVEKEPLPPLVNGNGLLSESCRFVISRDSKGECINMGNAVVVRASAAATE